MLMKQERLFNVGLVPFSSGPRLPYEHVINIYIAWCMFLKHHRLERPKRRLTPGNMVLALTEVISRKLEVSRKCNYSWMIATSH
jgi:hypothetical protein